MSHLAARRVWGMTIATAATLIACSRTALWSVGWMDCVAGTCREETWYSLGDSEFVPHSTFALWGSASGGGISNSAGSSFSPSLALDGGGHLVLAWRDATSGNGEIYVKRFNGSTWEELGTGSASGGGISASAIDPFSPSLVLDSTGNPMVAWASGPWSHRAIYVKHFDGVAWVEVGAGSASGGGVSGTAAEVADPSMAVDSVGSPVVAWVHQPVAAEPWRPGAIYVKRFDGASWVEAGVGSATGAGISGGTSVCDNPSLVLDSSDRPSVAWADNASGHFEIYVKRFDGGAWVEVGAESASGGGVSGGASASVSPSLAIGASGELVLAWADDVMGDGELYVKRFDGIAWQELGAGSATGGGLSGTAGVELSYVPNVPRALGGGSHPVAAWVDASSGNDEIYVRRFDGTSWGDLGIESASAGGVSDNAGQSQDPSLAVDGSGVPVVAWVDSTSGSREIYVKRFDGASWVEITAATISGGGVSCSTGRSQDPSLALDGSGHPLVAWEDTSSGNSEIYVRRFDGASWQEVGLGSASGGGISNNAGYSLAPSLALHASGNPMVAWSDNTALNAEIYVKVFDGVSWREVGAGSASGGGVSNAGTASQDPSLALGDSGQPVVAWTTNYEIYVKRFDGASWQEVGAGSASGGGISNNWGNSMAPSLALDAPGNPTVAWSDDTTFNTEIYVKRFDGVSWGPLGTSSASGGGVSNNAGMSMIPSLTLDGSGNAVLAWSDSTSGNSEIYVKRFDGTSWQEVGIGSASGGGVSTNAGDSTSPSLALDGSGQPLIVWQDASSGNVEVYARRFDGMRWTDLASPAAGGVSNSGARSAQPSVAIGSGRACVAWSEGGYASTEILLRCTNVP